MKQNKILIISNLLSLNRETKFPLDNDRTPDFYMNIYKLAWLYSKVGQRIFSLDPTKRTSQQFPGVEITPICANNCEVVLPLINEIIDYVNLPDTGELNEIAICGANTDLSILGNAIALTGLGDIKITVIEDACWGTSKKAHKKAIKQLQRFGINIISTNSYIENFSLH